MERYFSEKTVKELLEMDCGDIWKISYMIGVLNETPAADVVPIVRCKDCKKQDICRIWNIWAVPPKDDWYCADGERRE